MLAEQLGLGDDVQEAVGASYEQWDGKGWPGKLRGDAVPIGARIAGLAEFVEVAHRIGGVPAAIKLARKRSGKQFDPRVAAAVCGAPDDIFADLDTAQTWTAVIAAACFGLRLSARSSRPLPGGHELHRSEVAVLPRPRPGRCRSRAGGAALRRIG